MAWHWHGNSERTWPDQAWQDDQEEGRGQWQQEANQQQSSGVDEQHDPWESPGDREWSSQRTGWWGWGSWSWHDRSWNPWHNYDYQNRWWAYQDSNGSQTAEIRQPSMQVSEETPWDGQRRESASSVSRGDKVSEDLNPGDDDAEEVPQSSQTSASVTSRPREPKTGKDIIPAYDGSTPVRDFRRRVQLFEASTGIDKEFRAGRLVEQMSGLAWKCTETLDLSKLRSEGGVEYLLSHLQQELEPVEYIRVFETLHYFFKTFRRQKGESFVNFDMSFRSQMQKLDEVGAGLSGIVKSWWFLETAGLGQELRKQVVTASGGSCQYERLREALMAIVPECAEGR